eukprot:TRINITY_DN8825_c0_g1_i4.p1 TRINITY_DN8825_c0_g1~~TRINITY_DN8825_c0_g1_i4.p1  ORF type:complete len:113 (+),score=11.93 TRINITY_DN8825_c0_g1_i4:241-579(+)
MMLALSHSHVIVLLNASKRSWASIVTSTPNFFARSATAASAFSCNFDKLHFGSLELTLSGSGKLMNELVSLGMISATVSVFSTLKLLLLANSDRSPGKTESKQGRRLEGANE